MPRTAQWAALLAASLACGWLFELGRFPAALLLGPMVAGIAFALNGSTLRLPRPAFLAAQSIVGCLVGRAMTPQILASIVHSWAPLLAVTLATISAAAFVGWLLTKFAALPGTTAAWGSSPGGAAAMVAMSEEFGADRHLVAFMQYSRILVVIVTASLVGKLLGGSSAHGPLPQFVSQSNPLAIVETLAIAFGGAYLGLRFKLPAGALLLPMALSATAEASGFLTIALPPWLLAIAYAAVGWYVGLGFTRATVLVALRVLPAMLASTVLLIGLCAGSAWILVRFLHTDALTAYLATSPGGLDSVAIIALGSGANLPFVLAAQTLRLFFVLLTGPQVAKLITRFA